MGHFKFRYPSILNIGSPDSRIYSVMKTFTLLFSLLLAGLAANAQPKPNLVRQAEVKSVKIAKDAVVTGYEATIAAGRLSLAKVITAEEGEPVVQGYTLTLYSDNSFNNRKPVKIGLSRKSFDSVFTRGSAEMVAKYPKLNKYVTDNKLSLSEEKGWISIIEYFNTL